MEQEFIPSELSGTVDTVIYSNEENGYTILNISDENGERVTVTGCIPYASPGESIIVQGKWVNHPSYGRQFSAEFMQRIMPSAAKDIFKYLSGGAIAGIGPVTARQLVEKFGDDTLKILESHSERLTEIKGISPKKASQLSKTFRRQAGVRRLTEYVCSFGLRPVIALRLYKYYGDEAMNVLQENPYVIATSHIGGKFSEADALALENGLDEYSEYRIEAAALYELYYNSLSNGHCFIPKEKLAAATSSLIGVDDESAMDSIDTLIEQGRISYEEIAACRACYLPLLYEAETDAARRISKMYGKQFDDRVNVERIITSLEKKLGIEYNLKQRSALSLALRHQMVVITGGPGTGKTMTIRAILSMFESIGLKTLLAAPTGRAAKRMSELTGHDASTVHRLLGFRYADDDDNVVFDKNESDRLDCNAVILDECSMVDIQLFDALIRAMPDDARLVLVGDVDQLPSVGPGNVFSSIIRSETVPTVRLTEIYRQSGGSRIIRNAYQINKGEHPNLKENSGDFFCLRRLEAASSVETVTELCAVRLPGKMNIPMSDIQVLSPTRKGELGTVNLNKKLQEVLNPPADDKKERTFGDTVFRVGDRVMQIKNNYDIMWRSTDGKLVGTGMFNGDIGNIVAIDRDSETLTVDFDGKLTPYTFDSLSELEHAWAITVHKSQGSEYRAVVLALGGSSSTLMTRGVLYTAVTRAKELLILVGDDGVAYQMIDNFRQVRRYNALRLRIRKLCGLDEA